MVCKYVYKIHDKMTLFGEFSFFCLNYDNINLIHTGGIKMFKFYDLLKIIDTTNMNFHETFIILRVIEELLEKHPDYNKTINLLIQITLIMLKICFI